MIAPELPTDEAARLESLRALDILDTPPEERFDRITRLASTLFDAPIAYITMVDANRQWFKSSCGLNATETDRDVSFCGHAILEDEALVIPDATADPRFADNPQVVGEPHIRFYVGQPLRGPEGHNVGTLCVADREPRDTVPADDRRALADLATVVEKELNLQDMATLQEKLLEASERAHEAQAESERLLLNILPRPVADQLRNGEADVVDHYPEATVLFADGSARPARWWACSTSSSVASIGWFKTGASRRSRPWAMPTWWPADCPRRAPTTPTRWWPWDGTCSTPSTNLTTSAGPICSFASASTRVRLRPASSARTSSSTTCGATP